MPAKPLRPCKQHGCKNLTRTKYCEVHISKEQEETRYYDKQVRDKRSTSFYRSSEWRKMRSYIMQRDRGICQKCLLNDRLVLANVVHHIVEVKEDWSKRLDTSNLVSICHACHNKIHGNK